MRARTPRMIRNAWMIGIAAALTAVSAAYAGPGNNLHFGAWTLIPGVDVGVTHDSNINRSSHDPIDDTYLDSAVDLCAGYSAVDLEGSFMGFAGTRNYMDHTENDYDSAGEVVRVIKGTRDRVRLEADQSFRRVEDVDRYAADVGVGGISPDSALDASTRDRRDINQAALSASRSMTDKTDLDLGYRYDAVTYDDPALYDLTSHGLQMETAYNVSDKSAMLLTLTGQRQEASGADDHATYGSVRAGMKTRGTDRLIFKGGVGVQRFDVPGNSGLDSTSMNVDLSAMWLATDKLVVQAGGRNGNSLSSLYADNGVRFALAWLGATCRVTPALGVSLNGIYRVDTYLEPVTTDGRADDREDRGLGVRLRSDYHTPANFLDVYGEVSHEAVQSEADNNETRVVVGLSAKY